MRSHLATLSRATAMASVLLTAPAFAGDGYGPADKVGAPMQVEVGGIVVISPVYEGSKKYEVTGYPVIFPAGIGSGDGFVQFRGIDDLRFRIFQHSGFEAGPLVGWRFDRDDNDDNRIRGLGDVDGGLVLGGYVGYRIGGIMPFISYHHQITGDETGGLTRFGVEGRMPLGGGATLLATVGATYADDDYMDAYFSVTPLQSLNSVAGLGVFNADAGIKDIYVSLSADVPLTPLWTLKLSGKYARLLGDAADSPVVEQENQFTAGIGLTYKLDLAP
jgi:outer membrane protein